MSLLRKLAWVPEPAKISAALASRYGELLNPRMFRVKRQDTQVVVEVISGRSHGSAKVGPGLAVLYLPMPATWRLALFFDNEARDLASFASGVGPPWPGARARPRVKIGPTEIEVWYEFPDETRPPVRWRPIGRDEIGWS